MIDFGSQRVFLVGGGPSLKGFDFTRLAGKGVIVGINYSIFDVECNFGVSIDQRFMLDNATAQNLNIFAASKPLFLCPPTSQVKAVVSKIPEAVIIPEADSFTLDPGSCHRQGGTSGYAALDIAASRGAKDIMLLGFDYRPGHYHDGYAWSRGDKDNWAQWALNFGPMNRVLEAAGIKVLNASPDSRISCFPKVTLDGVL
jgi:hypothetical protein